MPALTLQLEQPSLELVDSIAVNCLRLAEAEQKKVLSLQLCSALLKF